jgi:uncharacterized protein YfaP (DUF2135 family)
MYRSLALLLAVLTTAATAQTPPQLYTPRGGWRYTEPGQRDFLQTVTYPAASVNASGLSAAALIQGRLGPAAKGGRTGPATLVVDGVALPLLTDEAGAFARPWRFGPGSHGVEVRSSATAPAKRVQFYEAHSSGGKTRLRVVLSWDSPGTDVDLHVVSPDGQHVYFGDRVAANRGALDVDVTTGYGPEIFATPAPVRGAYHVFVNFFGMGERSQDLTVAQVAVIQNEGTLAERQQLFRVPLRNPGELTRVASFLVP